MSKHYKLNLEQWTDLYFKSKELKFVELIGIIADAGPNDAAVIRCKRKKNDSEILWLVYPCYAAQNADIRNYCGCYGENAHFNKDGSFSMR